jgi:peptidoglycan/LPS O-acetylase OafA/YrhL
MKYRAEIDGLRALAVGSVVLFHAGFTTLGGGFVGVDIFFVISGFLITKILVGEIDGAGFSLVNFYERRARRILPALFVVLAVTLVVGGAILVPANLEPVALSGAAAALSVSNFYFWRTTDYFGLGAPFSPLLHTWSLGVEEQFYLVFPVYLIAARRWLKWSWSAILAPLFVISLVVSIVLVRTNPTAAFYLPFGRMWELMIGSFLAVGRPRPIENRMAREILGGLGVAAIVAAVLLYREEMPFPGESALLPCLGAGLIIYATAQSGTLVGTWLSSRPLVFIGRISYSLYLWHWPVLVFSRIILDREPGPLANAVALAIAFGLSVLSWRYVEQPFRHAGLIKTRRGVFVASGAVMALVSAFGALAWVGDGLPQRFPKDVQVLAAGANDINPRREECDSRSIEQIRRGDVCTIGANVTPTVALVGDSFGDAVAPGLDAAAREAGIGVEVLTRAGCRPLIVRTQTPRECDQVAGAVGQHIASSSNIRSVILVGRWSKMLEGGRFGAVSDHATFMTDEQTPDQSRAGGEAVFRRALGRTLASYGPDKRVFVVGFMPEQQKLVPQSLVLQAILGRSTSSGVARATFEARQKTVRRILADPTLPEFVLIDASNYLCDRTTCPIEAEGRALYYDDNHLSRTGALRARGMFDPALNRLMAANRPRPAGERSQSDLF